MSPNAAAASLQLKKTLVRLSAFVQDTKLPNYKMMELAEVRKEISQAIIILEAKPSDG